MAKRVFFSFHYENDVWRANVVRNSWVTKADAETAGFIDAADFEEVKKGGDSAIRRWIEKQLESTTVTIVLIGTQTSQREYVKFELEKSFQRGNAMLGIYIHQIKDRYGSVSVKGSNHFGEIGKDSNSNPVYFSSRYQTFDWVDDNGYDNIGEWVKDAKK